MRASTRVRVRHGFATVAMRDERVKARWKIVQEVNKFKLRSRMPVFTNVPALDGKHGTVRTVHFLEARLFGMKNLQQAVRIARHHGLVDSEVLRRAGFNGR